MACAASGGRAHPVIGLWPIRLKDDLSRAMAEEGLRKVDAWTARYRLTEVDFPTDPVDPFINTNRPEDLEEEESLLAEGGPSPNPGATKTRVAGKRGVVGGNIGGAQIIKTRRNTI